MTTRVLVVEDDPAIQELIRFTLEKAGLKAAVAASAEEALTALKAALPDVVLIDWMLPKMSGLALARQLREAARTEKLPLIMVTARGEEADRVAGLEQGADDYLVKPFSPRELLARIQAVLRRRAPHAAETTLVFGPLHLDPVSYEVRLDGIPVELAPTEFKLLRFFMAHPGRVFSRPQVLDQVWGDHVFIEERTVDVHIRRLRQALGPQGEQLIETVRGAGYKLALPRSA
ncbi:MAG: phosphate regulon transcriptional regulator PhoB [Rhodocyclaceae bacterium]|jgi:two-component system phosphate regulon response regulator PhoB|nr:Phosphate regulon transcriptional regulatory protein PhoB [Rhodocyclaceae bacterium]MBZ0144700.1 phosphate regulon transcriptional regulator PhoB [Rhodocyclaceae bacterium]MCL4680766.1 phosphate regulon transcriptional regulator PhoB [Rhodocyclaceae bacterium]